MSEVYSNEPKTSGKVIIYTSLGELEILLFSNECPVACQNFIQLCFNKYYNKNKIFRIIPNLLIHTGDHTNTGMHHEYAFNEPFSGEYNSRLKFKYCGCLGFFRISENESLFGSQFIITLNKFEYFNNKCVLFGKVAKHSLYNLLKFNNVKTNKYDEPIGADAPYIESVKIIENPFTHLVPSQNYEKKISYEIKEKEKKENIVTPLKKKRLKNNLLSFSNAEDEIKEEGDNGNAIYKQKEETIEQVEEQEKNNQEKNEADEKIPNTEKKANIENKDSDFYKNKIESDKQTESVNYIKKEEEEEEEEEEEKKKQKRKLEKINYLKDKTKEIQNSKNDNKKRSLEFLNENNMLKECMKKYKKMSKKTREEMALNKLEEFNKRLENIFSKKEKGDDIAEHDWLNTDGLKFHVDSTNAFEHSEIKKKIENSLPIEERKNYESTANVKVYLKKKTGEEIND